MTPGTAMAQTIRLGADTAMPGSVSGPLRDYSGEPPKRSLYVSRSSSVSLAKRTGGTVKGVPGARGGGVRASSAVTRVAVSSFRAKAWRMAAEVAGMNGSETTAYRWIRFIAVRRV